MNLRIASTLILLAACADPLAPTPLALSAREITLSEGARLTWPTFAVAQHADSLVISGWAFLGCGRVAASGTRARSSIDLRVSSAGSDRPCLAVVASWRPYEVAISLEPGDAARRVRATVVGYKGPLVETSRDPAPEGG